MKDDTVPPVREITDYIEGYHTPDGRYAPGRFVTTNHAVASVMFRAPSLVNGLEEIVEFPGVPGDQIPSAGWISRWIYAD